MRGRWGGTGERGNGRTGEHWTGRGAAQRWPLSLIPQITLPRLAAARRESLYAEASFAFLIECPVIRPKTNSTSATAPMAKMVSPKTLLHLNIATVGE
jgi:hypothetical protein